MTPTRGHGRESIMTFEFFMPMEHVPTVTHQEHGVRVQNGKTIFYDTEELKAARQKYTDMLALHKPDRKLTGPLHLQVVWCFLSDRHPDGAWRTTKPDTDNLQKLLKDCMTKAGFWEDDAQVVREEVEKRWVRGIRKGGTASGIWISVHEMEEMYGLDN